MGGVHSTRQWLDDIATKVNTYHEKGERTTPLNYNLTSNESFFRLYSSYLPRRQCC
ncbi:hypothetical protein X777_05673 [Ooceraea biroi]|uniref:Uncharacterized protein n=1 Tax=Ooceraea biroi TaxID=2015173 RepID=A0A026WEQ4_OOCBI|nr:hypothetical protein X777_05673 [Ooceraea biroi]